MSLVDIASVLSFAIGVAGLGLAVYERKSRISVELAMLSQLSMEMNRIRSMVVYRNSLREFIDANDKSDLEAWAWGVYKGMSDLYVASVTQYLSTQKTFTYDDLSRLVKSELISTAWEERVWRDLIALRSENRFSEAPERLLANNDNHFNST